VGFNNNYHKVIEKWGIEGNHFESKNSCIYSSSNLREPCIYVVSFISMLYGEKDAQNFKVSWIHSIHAIVKEGLVFN
jgi:hypothetical protein